jgi:RNA polymerase sigma-70 factor (ECF subfamily)
MDREQEKKLIISIQTGDRQAFAKLVDHYKTPVFNLIYRMTNGSVQERDDLAQETFLRTYEGLGNFDPQKRLFPWLYTICLNVVRNHLKKKKPVLMPEDVLAGHQEKEKQTNPEKLYSQHQENEIVQACLQRLPEDQRSAIVLRFFQDMAFDDIAQILGLSTSGVKMRVYRGLAGLRMELNQKKEKNPLR